MKRCERCTNVSCQRFEMFGQAGCDSYWEVKDTGEPSYIDSPIDYEGLETLIASTFVNRCPFREVIGSCGCNASCKVGKNDLEDKVSQGRCIVCMKNNEEKILRGKCSTCPFSGDERECWAQTQSIRTCRQTNKDDIYNEEIVRLIIHNTEFPDIKKQARSFLTSVIKHVGDKGKKAEPEKLEERRKICGECPFNDGGRCKKCGCSIDVKTSWDSEKCPEDKW